MKDLPQFQWIPLSRKKLLLELMNLDVSGLSDFDLDFWVAISEGYVMNPYINRAEAHMVRDDLWVLPGKRILPSDEINGYSYYPSSNYIQAAPLIVAKNIKSKRSDDVWHSVIPGNTWMISGDTKLESAMRCLVSNFKRNL